MIAAFAPFREPLSIRRGSGRPRGGVAGHAPRRDGPLPAKQGPTCLDTWHLLSNFGFSTNANQCQGFHGLPIDGRASTSWSCGSAFFSSSSGRTCGFRMAANTTTGATVAMEAGKVFPPLDATTFAPQLFWLALTFCLLYVLMKRLALPKVEAAIKERRQSIEGDLKTAEKLKAETQLALSRYELALSEARERASAIAKDLRDKMA